LFTFTRSITLVLRFVTTVFPMVSRELDAWRQLAIHNTDSELASQALASIRDKKFHCQGGCIYSLYPGADKKALVRLIVALQTISDYLDNLCDRVNIYDEAAFRQLHLAMTDALDPDTPLQDYYQFYPLKDDGAYLRKLVKTCRHEVSRLPSYDVVKPAVLQLVSLYSQLQTLKHLAPNVREQRMLSWIASHLPDYPRLLPWEFAAATGSTLSLFMLCSAASKPHLTAAESSAICTAYFPFICGLHILLDYFIDAAEDRQQGDLNFIAYYDNDAQTVERLSYFVDQALSQAVKLPEPLFHQTIVQGLLAMYLSDPKTNQPHERAIKTTLLQQAGWFTRICYGTCRLLRVRKVL